MLKKIFIACALLASSTMAFANGGTYLPAAPHYNGNFYLGVGIARDTGRANVVDSVSTNDSTIPRLHAINGDLGIDGIAGRLVGGYGVTFMNRYYLAVEGFGELTSNQGKTTIVGNGGVGSEAWQLRERYSYGVRLVPGFKLTDSTMFYGTVGWVRSRFQLTNSGKGSFDQTGFVYIPNGVEKSRNGIAAGAGLQVMLANNVSMRAGWEWRRYRSFNSPLATRVIEQSIVARSRAEIKHLTTDQFYLDMIYHFTT
ncbi:MAG: outer membrane beta-barrel protein [Pseudomonadota bacterium]